MAGQIGRAAHRGGDAAEARTSSRRPRLAECGDADHHEAAVHRVELVPPEAPALYCSGTEILGEHVGGGGEALQQRLALGHAEVAGDRLLVARLDQPPVRLSARRAPAEATQIVADPGLLDLDHGGAELAEQ